MDPLLILAVGMAVVIGGILWCKLHPFLALMSGALIVSALSSSSDLYRREIQSSGWQVHQVDGDRIQLVHEDSVGLPGTDTFRVVRLAAGDSDASGSRGDVALVPDNARVGWYDAVEPSDIGIQAGDWLVDPSEETAAAKLRASSWPNRIAAGFGTTCSKIGIVIALAAVIGGCLLESGAAQRIVVAMRSSFGESRTPLALVVSGFVIGIPVYFDTVFYLLLPLARALGRQTGRNYLLYILSIIVGATMAHSLVPPTPGPLLVASELGVPIGQMIMAGGIVGLVAATVGFGFAVWVNGRMTIEVPDAGNDQLETRTEGSLEADLAQGHAPSLMASLLPIILPVALLSLGTVLRVDSSGSQDGIRAALLLLTDKHMALGLAAVAAIVMLVKHPPESRSWSQSIQETMLGAGNIVLITAAGGAFGHVLRQSGIAEAIQHRFPITQSAMGLLLIAFGVTAVVRVAQGSATVAMITAVGIVAPLVDAIELPFPAVFVALAIGCGSKPMPWMNDSGFWVITRMSGMSESQSLRTFSVALTIMGVVGMAITLAGAAIFASG